MGRTMRFTKDKTRVFEITCSRGRDPLTGKRLSPYSMRWEVPKGYSDKKADKEAAIIEAQFIADCNAGKIKTKQEQKVEAVQKALQIEKDNLEYSQSATLSELISWYKTARKTQVKPGTIESWTGAFLKLQNTFHDMKVIDITPAMMKKWNVELLNSGLKYSSYSTNYDVINKFFGFLEENERIPESPMRKVKKLPKPKEIEVSSRNKELSYEEFARYREGIMNESPMHRTMMELMVFTGIRRGEVAPLEWSDFDFDNGVMYITKNEQYTQERGWYITTPKSGKARMIPLSSYIVDVMKEWQRTQALNNLLKKGITENKYCFEGIDEGCINPRAISNYCLAFGKKYGIEHFHPHRLRHTFASFYETNQSGDMVSLQEILGHADISTTMRYVHTNLEAKRKAMDNYGNVMAPVKDVLYAKTKG